MSINLTPVNRNLATKVTFCYLEFEDLFAVLLVAAGMNFVSRLVHGTVGGIPASVLVQYGVPLSIIPMLMAFKYGKPRGYAKDLLVWHLRPRRYCGAARDRQQQTVDLQGD
jgi:hypothetical protein